MVLVGCTEMNAAPFGLNISAMKLRFQWVVWLPLSWAVTLAEGVKGFSTWVLGKG